MEDDERPEGWTEDRPPTEEELEHARQVHPSWVHPMSDDDHEGPAMAIPFGPGMLVRVGPTPDQIDRQMMAMDSAKHEMYRLWETLNEDQMMSLVKLLNICADPEEGQMYANHFEGITQGIMSVKFGHCLACGRNHDKEAAELMESEQAPPSDESAPE